MSNNSAFLKNNMADQKSSKTQMNFNGSVYGVAGTVEGDMIVNPKQNLAESASEIRELLQVLQNSNEQVILSETQQQKVDDAIQGIESNPKLRDRIMGAFRSGGMEAVKEITDSPYLNVLLATYEGFREP